MVGADVAGLRQEDLETVVPREDNATVLIVRGAAAGQRARLMEVIPCVWHPWAGWSGGRVTFVAVWVMQRDRKKERVYLQLAGESGLLQLSFDDVCEFVGARRSEDW